jgi:hypothetical protein
VILLAGHAIDLRFLISLLSVSGHSVVGPRLALGPVLAGLIRHLYVRHEVGARVRP